MPQEQIDVATLKLLAGLAGSLAGWIALRLEAFGQRLVKVETKLENGLSSKLDGLQERIEAHIDGEEERILLALQRQRRSGRDRRIKEKRSA